MHIADIAIRHDLAPGPAMFMLIDSKKLSAKKFGLLRAMRLRPGPHGGMAAQGHALLAFNKAFRFDLALEMNRGEVWAGRGKALIHAVLSTTHKEHGQHSLPRLCGGPALA